MRLGGRIAVVGAAVAAGMLAAAQTALAADVYASPTGTGPTPCLSSAPCDIYTAASFAPLTAGNNVLLMPGTYNLPDGGGGGSGDLELLGSPNSFTVKPAVPGNRPTIQSTVDHSVIVASGPVTIEDVRIDISGTIGGTRALNFQVAGTARRVQIVSAGTNPVGVLVKNGALLTDSTVYSPSTDATAIVTGGTGGTIRNVTAINPGVDTFGIAADGAFGDPQTVTVQNTLVRSEDGDIEAFNGTSADSVKVNVENSDYVIAVENPPNSRIHDLGGNTSAAPLLANLVGGDFHQLAGSPTINAGKVVAGLSSTAFDGQARIIGPLPDIGADEFQPPAPPPPPAGGGPTPTTSNPGTGQRAAALKKCKKKRSAAARRKCRKRAQLLPL
jgi:hypothetical protein